MTEDDDLEQLRSALHREVDELFSVIEDGIKLEWAALRLAGKLIKVSENWIDLNVGRELSAAAVKHPEEALRLGREVRQQAKAARYGVDGQTPETTAQQGLIGTLALIRNLAAYCDDDPFLHHLAIALEHLRHGQHHPWLELPTAKVRPAAHAKSILGLRAIPFGVIEYLTASGSYPTKTKARGAVVERLGILEDALMDWRKQQNRERRGDFDAELWASRRIGEDVKRYRRNVSDRKELEKFLKFYEERFGLPAVDRCAIALCKLKVAD
jgi:hypothetical protein